MSILVFDTETTGLPFGKLEDETLHLWPYIVQFSYILYDSNSNKLTKIKDNIIEVPISIPEESTKIHGITDKMSQESGIKLENILEEFFNDYIKTDYIVGHNISFDINIVKVELKRIMKNSMGNVRKMKRIQYYLDLLENKNKIYCTMRETIQLCAIEKINKFGYPYYKFPKLVELYDKLFSEKPNHLHNSLNDVIVCLRCFMKLKYKKDIVQENKHIQHLIAVC
jgi:DNA polymerase III epsilon subunit-like protein